MNAQGAIAIDGNELFIFLKGQFYCATENFKFSKIESEWDIWQNAKVRNCQALCSEITKIQPKFHSLPFVQILYEVYKHILYIECGLDHFKEQDMK